MIMTSHFMSLKPSKTKQISINNIDVMLNDLLLKHKASLLLYDEICNLFNSYLDSLGFDRYVRLKSRKSLLMSAQKSMNTLSLWPIDGTVQLHDKSLVTVPVFNTKHMIMNLLTDSKLMNDQNFPKGYNVLTGWILGKLGWAQAQVMLYCHDWGSKPTWSASHIHFICIHSVSAPWYAVDGHMVRPYTVTPVQVSGGF